MGGFWMYQVLLPVEYGNRRKGHSSCRGVFVGTGGSLQEGMVRGGLAGSKDSAAR